MSITFLHPRSSNHERHSRIGDDLSSEDAFEMANFDDLFADLTPEDENQNGTRLTTQDITRNPMLEPSSPSVQTSISTNNTMLRQLSTTPSPVPQDISEEIIFDAISPNFDFKVFLKQLLSHVLIFLAPFLLNNLTVNHFIRSSTFAIFFNTGLPLLVYIIILSYLLTDNSNSEILSGALFFPVIYFIQHKLIVAVKYASLSTTEYYRIMNCKEEKLVDHYQSQLQLISGWLYRKDTVIEFELNAASVRIGTKISNVYFIIPDPKKAMNQEKSKLSQYRHWIALLRGLMYIDVRAKPTSELEYVEIIKKRSTNIPSPSSSPQITRSKDEKNDKNETKQPPQIDDAYYRISVYDLCLTLIRRCDERSISSTGLNDNFFIATWVYNSINLLIPIVALAAQSEQVNYEDPWLYIFILSSSIINLLFGLLVFNLLYVSVFDVTRQLTIFRDLSRLARVNDLELGGNDMTSSTPISSHDTEIIKLQMKNATQTQSAIRHLNKSKSSSTESKKPKIIVDENISDEMLMKSMLGEETANACFRNNNDHEKERLLEKTMMKMMDDGYVCLGERMANNNTLSEIPRLDFDYIENVIAWTYSRLIFQNFGDRYRFRIDIYVGGTIAIMVLLVIISLIQVILLDNRIDALTHCFFLQSLAGITFVFLFLFIISMISSLINNEMEIHNQLLSRQILRLRNKIFSTRHHAGHQHHEEMKERYEEIIEQLESSLAIFEKENELKPFTIFGVTASDSLTLTIVSGISSFFFALISLFAANSPVFSSLSQF